MCAYDPIWVWCGVRLEGLRLDSDSVEHRNHQTNSWFKVVARLHQTGSGKQATKCQRGRIASHCVLASAPVGNAKTEKVYVYIYIYVYVLDDLHTYSDWTPVGARLEYIHMLRKMMICILATMGFRLDWDVRLNTDWNPTWLQVWRLFVFGKMIRNDLMTSRWSHLLLHVCRDDMQWRTRHTAR